MEEKNGGDLEAMSFVSDNIELLSGIAVCIAKQFGPDCEVVIHDLTLPYDQTVVFIENGHVTGRKVGDAGTNIGLEVLRGTAECSDAFNYINHSKGGRILRSSSKYFRDADGNVVGSLCINYDMTDLILAQRSLQNAANLPPSTEVKENFTATVDELLDLLMQDTVQLIGKPVNLMTKEDKVFAINHLDKKGAFLIKKSVDTVSAFFGISKFTLYNYLSEGKANNQASPMPSEPDKIP